MRFPHAVIIRAPGLLPMLYTPTELEEDLRVPARTVREWIKKGMPHQRDVRGHILIDGRRFAGWVRSHRRVRASRQLAENEAYCLQCRKFVELQNPTQVGEGRRGLLKGTCPECGRTMHRGYRVGQPQ
jgi:hypothetical protein